MNEEDIPLPSIVRLRGSLRNSRCVTTGIASQRSFGMDATPAAVRQLPPRAAGKTRSRGHQTRTVPKRHLSAVNDQAVRKDNSATTPAPLLAAFWGGCLVLGRLLASYYGRGQNVLLLR